MDLSEFQDPVEVWKAVEGDRQALVDLLRSETRLTRWTRNELADWLEGKLKPVKLAKGRPQTHSNYLSVIWRGHDRSLLGTVGWRYEVTRDFIRKKGWHKIGAGSLHWSTERLQSAFAEKYKIDLEKFINYLNRSRRKPSERSWDDPGEYVAERRREIAIEILRTKIGRKG